MTVDDVKGREFAEGYLITVASGRVPHRSLPKTLITLVVKDPDCAKVAETIPDQRFRMGRRREHLYLNHRRGH